MVLVVITVFVLITQQHVCMYLFSQRFEYDELCSLTHDLHFFVTVVAVAGFFFISIPIVAITVTVVTVQSVVAGATAAAASLVEMSVPKKKHQLFLPSCVLPLSSVLSALFSCN